MNVDKNDFEFTQDNIKKAQNAIKKYPKNQQRSAVIALLDIAQNQNDGWLSKEAIEYVANMLEMPVIRTYEIATFYTMFNLKPVGKYHIQICGTTPCWLRGSDDVKIACEKKLGINCGENGNEKFTITEVECLGACINAPVVQINNKQYIEDVTPAKMVDLLENIEKNKSIIPNFK
ncbi:MAG: NADH-quinone oxidoreductase subunit NuoE [Rickettsiaceae bacterium]